MNKEWKLTQTQFDWLVDIVMTHNEYNDYPYSLRKTASKLLKKYGHQGWYDVNGKMSLILLTEMVREFKHKKDGVDDLPF